ncbi:MAG: sugar transferase [Deltaproteobacteria bacterium]|nr:MAG: sugar transferase [Deltaproteobacteria bacterium]
MNETVKIKRFFDLYVLMAGAIVFLPILACTALLVKLKIGKPIFFTQKRPGLHGKPFSIYKFRTMTNEKDMDGNLLPDDIRLVPFGIFLRNTSLDELPELYNVFKGEMSLVGPRPLLLEYLSLYTQEQFRRHEVKPGITGWAQVNGRNNLSWEDKFRLDVWYVDHWSLGLDMKIILQTVVSIFKRDGINQPGQATAEKFKGSA